MLIPGRCSMAPARGATTFPGFHIRVDSLLTLALAKKNDCCLIYIALLHYNVKALVVAGDQAQVEKRLRELLASGLDELLLMLVPVADEVREREQLMQVIASL
jgi:alkanesulfonate monooxygenase SsuD/methylene tetrahydromethanopterin reductase-like flavin-dependent oxidoreductase (luciferase family)